MKLCLCFVLKGYIFILLKEVNVGLKKVFLFVIFSGMLVTIIGCGNYKQLKKVKNVESPAFVSKCVVEEGTDQWFNYFCIELPKKDKEKKSVDGNYKFDNTVAYTFDGINLKYKNLDDHYIPIYDNNNKEIDKVEAPYPSLSVSTVYRDEIKTINKFFNEKKFSKKISIKDLIELELQKIKKETLINMFNMAYDKKPISLGKYINLPFVSILSSVSDNGYIFQVGYYVEYGNVIKVNIEIIYDDGTYLSDLVANEGASITQQNLDNKITKIEEFIILNQDFDISNCSAYDESLKMLLNVMKRIIKLNE